jgi:transposase
MEPATSRDSAAFKAAVIKQCMRLAWLLALAQSLNANMLRNWVIDAENALLGSP